MYKAFFILFTFAEIIFTIIYYFLKKKLDNMTLVGAIIYAGGMIIGFIAYKVSEYNRRRRELIDSLGE